MNYNTLCLQLSSCLHSSTLTSSLLPPSFTFLSASLLHASLLPCLFSLFGFLCNPFSTSLLLEPSLFLFSAFYSDSIRFDIYLYFSFPLCSFSSYLLPVCLLHHLPSLLLCSISSQTLSPGSPLYCLGRLESHCFL